MTPPPNEASEELAARLERFILDWAEAQNSPCTALAIADAIMELFERLPMIGSLIEQRMEERLNHNLECLLEDKEIPLWGEKYSGSGPHP